MKRNHKLVMILGKVLASFAFLVGVVTANSACFSIWHQPKEPVEMNKFKF